MHISDVHEYGEQDEHTAATEPFIQQNRRKQIKSEIEQLVNEEFDRLQDNANDYISNLAADRAERFLEKVLQGDDDAAMALLGSSSNGHRYKTIGCEEGKPWAQLIHGRLFETGGITLRRRIVEANVDLIHTERIADLESIVDGLSQQIRKLEKQLEDN